MNGHFEPELVSLIITLVTLVTFWGVTDVTDVTQMGCGPKKWSKGYFSTPTFPWNCNERSGWPIFCKIIYLIDDDDF